MSIRTMKHMVAGLSKILKIIPSTDVRRSFLRFISSKSEIDCRSYLNRLVWSTQVNNIGKLRVCSGIELHVRPSDTWRTQDYVAAYIIPSSQNALKGIEENLKDILECIVCPSGDETQGTYIELNIDAGNMLSKYGPSVVDSSKLLIEVPCSYHLDINSSFSPKPVTVEKFEGDIEIRAMGDCILSQLKSRSVTVNTVQGNITGMSLVGDMVLTNVNDGKITVNKLQGNNIKIHCEDGELTIKSLYGSDTVITSSSGDIHIGDAHGNVNLTSSNGNVTVGSICGLLTAALEHGCIQAKITTGGNVDVVCENGNAVIKIDENIRCRLHLSAESIDISSDCDISKKHEQLQSGNVICVRGQTEGFGEQRIRVNCPRGDLKFLKESWFALSND